MCEYISSILFFRRNWLWREERDGRVVAKMGWMWDWREGSGGGVGRSGEVEGANGE